ncbi:hypothetical protein JQ596_25870 [Bradyrhizobium manausense]|uniref:hypothetical protein n=1 Tax=Bradyrhizobium TaxID=374 RepID=UPI001BAA2DF2|nr:MULTISPECIES: hypothetical protein [Bradyrhizobium]MBR0828967.1 hypothetical protein [Bradyrhizobium manausense]UVO28027.1 hypothetical protein KUF59_37070 [Bradyrhizobium arachidis]
MLDYLSYAVSWPPIFAFAILPGVLIGSIIRTWQFSIFVAEALTVIAAYATKGRLSGEWLFHMHLMLFPPLLLSILIGHFGARS